MQQFVILPRTTKDNLGTRDDVIKQLQKYNTSSSCEETPHVLWGPGIRIDLPNQQDPIPQMLLTFEEEEIAWNVLIKLAKECQWLIQDTESGRTLSPD